MIYSEQEIQATYDDASFLMADAVWMLIRNEEWIKGIIKLCHTGK